MKSRLLLVCLTVLSLLSISVFVMASDRGELTIVTETKPLGQVVTAIIIEYPELIEADQVSAEQFAVKANRINHKGEGELAPRTITKVYTNNKAELSPESKTGKFVVIELYANDANAGTIYYTFNDLGGFNYNYKVEYTVDQKSNIKAVDGTILTAGTMLGSKRKNLLVDKFENLMYRSDSGKTLAYSLYIPEGYNPDRFYPLVLFLHGAGERGNNNQVQLKANTGAIVWASEEVQSKYPAFVLAPQCPQNSSWTELLTGGDQYKPTVYLEMVYDLLMNLTQKYSLDNNKLYSTGVSMGGYGTWAINLAHPDTFAAMVPVCGGADILQADLLVDKAIWNFHAEDDPVVPVSASREIVKALLELGSEIKYTEYDRGVVAPPMASMAHFSWVPAYNNKELVDWLFAQRRSDNYSAF